MNNKINSQKELYNRISPALRTKKHELFIDGYKFVKERDIWDYNKEYIWVNSKGLTIAQIVDNILNTSNKEYANYVLNKINRKDD
ncbi:MAG TPA: post-transcriptional regulator [Bacilli bacterium]|jgi:hypothetical protein|nr:post-transcriptional regulator [Bacilli bacterium]HPZ23684.1 post-transcriptional regulator [Bacilli bacterium]HQC83433.1 post-transcriptional regulator [Bacilli bacterium]